MLSKTNRVAVYVTKTEKEAFTKSHVKSLRTEIRMPAGLYPKVSNRREMEGLSQDLELTGYTFGVL